MDRKVRKIRWISPRLLLFCAISFSIFVVLVFGYREPPGEYKKPWRDAERKRVVAAAQRYLKEEPITVTAFRSERSRGDLHDYYSEGDYWWPDPENPKGVYKHRDGFSNPNAFLSHRRALMRFSFIVPALVAAYKVTGNEQFASHARKHLRAWFVADETRMNPRLRFAQAVYGKAPGRSFGTVDTIHLVEVAQAVRVLHSEGGISNKEYNLIRKWFKAYLEWLRTSTFGKNVKTARNNHAASWTLQVAAYSRLTGKQKTLFEAEERWKKILEKQLTKQGSFPAEIGRAKPYSYSLFMLELMTAATELFAKDGQSRWNYVTADGKGMKDAVAFMYPYIKNKNAWPFPKDVQYFDDWPARQMSLFLAAKAYGNEDYQRLWETLPPESEVEEVNRNLFLRQPLLWE